MMPELQVLENEVIPRFYLNLQKIPEKVLCMDRRLADVSHRVDQALRSCRRVEAITELMIACRPGHSPTAEQLSTIGDMIRAEAELLRECVGQMEDSR